MSRNSEVDFQKFKELQNPGIQTKRKKREDKIPKGVQVYEL